MGFLMARSSLLRRGINIQANDWLAATPQPDCLHSQPDHISARPGSREQLDVQPATPLGPLHRIGWREEQRAGTRAQRAESREQRAESLERMRRALR